jgi:fatty-acyl-CoA synthase
MPGGAVSAFDWVEQHADIRPSKVALIDEWRDLTLTFGELGDRVRRLAAWLVANDVSRGDRVAFLSENTTDIFEALFACEKVGAILVPLNWRLALPELAFIIGDCTPHVLIHEAQFAESASVLEVPVKLALGAPFEKAKADSDPEAAPIMASTHDDPLAIMYTSGTTGRPKGAIETIGMFFWNAINIGAEVELTRSSVSLNVLPTFHTGGLNLYATALIHLGGTTVNLRAFDPEKVLQWLASGRITHFFAVPAVYQFLAEHDGWEAADLSPVRSWASGGSALPVALLERYADRGIVIRQGMGLTETSPTLFLTDEDHALSKAGSVGKTAMHTEIRIVDEVGNDLPRGAVGELWARGPNVTPGYWNRPEANRDLFTDGWLHTGDAATMDDDGYVFIVDRWKDMYISGGENVYPAEIEQVYFRHPNVVDVSVIGVPDERWGESGLAVVVPRDVDAFDEAEFLEFGNGHLARYKLPKAAWVVDEIPRNAAGKVLKNELRARAADR